MTTLSKDEFVPMALDHSCGTLKNLAWSSGIDDWQDLRQAAAIDLLVSFERIQAARNPQAYAATVIRTAAFQYIRTYKHMMSLDEPRREDSETPFSELLEMPVADVQQDYTAQDAKAAALHQALRKLPLEEQQFLRGVYNLNAYNPALPRQADGTIRRPNYDRTRRAMSHMAYYRLRADQELAASILEVC